MNGTINCLAATIRRLHAERDAYHREMMREEREKFTALAECDELRALLRECRADREAIATFLEDAAEDLQHGNFGADADVQEHIAQLRAWAKMLREEK